MKQFFNMIRIIDWDTVLYILLIFPFKIEVFKNDKYIFSNKHTGLTCRGECQQLGVQDMCRDQHCPRSSAYSSSVVKVETENQNQVWKIKKRGTETQKAIECNKEPFFYI